MQKEIWRDVVGYEGLYQVSSIGRVKRLESFVYRHSKWGVHKLRVKEKMLSLPIHTSGYVRLNLCKDGKISSRYVHNLASHAFMGLPNTGYEVDHIDNNRLNNKISNLRYITIKENRSHFGNKFAKGSVKKT